MVSPIVLLFYCIPLAYEHATAFVKDALFMVRDAYDHLHTLWTYDYSDTRIAEEKARDSYLHIAGRPDRPIPGGPYRTAPVEAPVSRDIS